MRPSKRNLPKLIVGLVLVWGGIGAAPRFLTVTGGMFLFASRIPSVRLTIRARVAS